MRICSVWNRKYLAYLDSLVEGEDMKRWKTGDIVYVVNYDTAFNGRIGLIDRIDGEYHYVKMIGITQDVTLQLYRNEMMTEFDYWTLIYPDINFKNIEHFDKDLFQI